MQRLFRKSTVITLAVMAVFSSASGRDLPQILRDGVIGDPQILEAQANQRIAQTTLEKTEAALWPVVKASANQPVLSSGKNYKFNPGLEASWRIYDFGTTEAGIERDKIKTQYFSQKTNETAAEIAYELASDYLEALKSKMSLVVAKENLALHEHIVSQLEIIIQYDPGRRSEYTQAESRRIKVQESIINYERTLGLALRRMARYVSPPVAESELTDPFQHLEIEDLLARYQVSEEDTLAHPSYRAQARELESIEAAVQVAERSQYPALGVNAHASKDNSSIYLTVAMDVFNKQKAPDIQEQKYYAQAAKARLQKIYDSLKQRADVAALQMREDKSRIRVTTEQIRALKQVARDYEDQFKIARRSLLDVVNAYSELAGVQQIQVEAEYDLMKSKLDYLSATGALGKWAGIPNLGKEAEKPELPKTPSVQSVSLPTVEQPSDDIDIRSNGDEKIFARTSATGELLLEVNGQKLGGDNQ